MPRLASGSPRRTVARRVTGAARLAGAIVYAAFALYACSGGDGLKPVSATTSTPVGQLTGVAIVGQMLEAPVRLLVIGSDGNPLAGARVQWMASQDGKVSAAETMADVFGIASVRWTLGTAAGPQSLVAMVSGLPPVTFSVNATADRAAVIKLSTDIVRVTLLGDTVHFVANVEDQYGNAAASVVASTLEPGSDALSAVSGRFVARNRGTAFIRFSSDTASARLTVLVDPATPVVTRVSPDTLVPGVMALIEGSGFALVNDAVEVTVAGVRATVTRVTASSIEVRLPAAMPCGATMPRPVEVTVASARGSLSVPVRTATRVVLAKGESANILLAGQVQCTELVAPSGVPLRTKYMVAVINTSVTAAATSGFELRGAGAGALAGQTSTPRVSAAQLPRNPNPTSASPATRTPLVSVQELLTMRRVEAEHARHLDAQRALRVRFGSPAPTWRARSRAGLPRVSAAPAPVSVGDTVVLKALYSNCGAGTDIRSRVVYSGTRALVLEDVASPRAGTMDTQYALLGEEFDQVQYPLLRNHIGDPLAMSDAMGGDGRVTMLFTRFVNDTLPGIAGYVSACNFYPKSTFAASNEDEVFYARVANANESPEEWRRVTRSTVVHESKHLAAFALRFADGTQFEESWLEESTARIAEELYSRTFAGGGGWKGNTGYQSSVRCEVLQCDDRPLMMWKHFSVLHQYLRGVDTLTPIGAAASGDFTFYASGWSLVRWATDQFASAESSWLKELVRGGALTGLSHLSQHTGRPSGELLAEWALANAVFELENFQPARPELQFPSWNMRDIFAGLATTFPGSFVANPLRARAMSFGSFSLAVPRLRAFSSSYFSFDGLQTGSQMLELRGEGGAAVPPATLRMAVVRVE